MKKTIDTTTMGGRIKALRVKKGLTQEQLAELLFLNAKSISAYENNRNEVPNSMLLAIAKLLDSSADYILSGESAGIDPFWMELIRKVDGIQEEPLREMVKKQLQAVVGCAVNEG